MTAVSISGLFRWFFLNATFALAVPVHVNAFGHFDQKLRQSLCRLRQQRFPLRFSKQNTQTVPTFDDFQRLRVRRKFPDNRFPLYASMAVQNTNSGPWPPKP